MPILRDSKGDIIPFIFSQYLFYKSVKTIYLHANYRDCVWIKIFKIIIIYWKYNLRFIFYHFTVRIPNSFFAKWSIQVFVIIGIKFNFEKYFAVRYGRTSGGPSGPDKWLKRLTATGKVPKRGRKRTKRPRSKKGSYSINWKNFTKCYCCRRSRRRPLRKRNVLFARRKTRQRPPQCRSRRRNPSSGTKSFRKR